MKRLAQLLRYAAVSAIATTTSLSVLGVLVGTRALPAGWANVVATAIGTVPSFELNRRWVWNKRGRRAVGAEVAPFCVLSFSGLALSTLAVHFVAGWADVNGWSNGLRTVAVEGANVASFGSLWLAQFVILDRILFRARPVPVPAIDLTTVPGRRDERRTLEPVA